MLRYNRHRQQQQQQHHHHQQQQQQHQQQQPAACTCFNTSVKAHKCMNADAHTHETMHRQSFSVLASGCYLFLISFIQIRLLPVTYFRLGHLQKL